MATADYPQSRRELEERIGAFEAVHGRRPVILADDLVLLLLHELYGNRHDPSRLPPGSNLVEWRRRRYATERVAGCQVQPGADGFDLR